MVVVSESEGGQRPTGDTSGEADVREERCSADGPPIDTTTPPPHDRWIPARGGRDVWHTSLLPDMFPSTSLANGLHL